MKPKFAATGKTSTANDHFENRLKAKMKEDHGNTAGKPKSGANSESSAAGDKFENRLKSKMEKEANIKKHKPSSDDIVANLGAASDFDESAAFITNCSAEGKCNDILQYMHASPSLPPALILLALEKLLDSCSLAHGMFDSAHSSRELIKLNENWVEVIALQMSIHSTNEMVQLAALRAIWWIVAQDSRYASELTSHDDGLESLIMTMKNHRQARIQQCGSGLVACLTSNQNHASLMLSFNSGAVVERMGEALYFNSPSALNALFKLLMASRQSNASSDHLIKTIGHCTNRERRGGDILTNAMDTVLGVMIDCPKHTIVQIWACWLLCALFSHESRLSSCASEHTSLSTLISKILRHLEATTTALNTPLAVHESAICLLSSISCCSDDILVGKDEVFSRVVAGIMLAQPKSKAVAMYGCYCISNTLFIQEDTASALLRLEIEDEAVADIAINTIMLLTKKGFQAILTFLQNDQLLVSSIVECMRHHPNSSSVQMAGCDILSSIALDRIVMMNICSYGGASRIISSLYNLSDDRMLVGKAFMALANVIGLCDVAILKESRAPESILRAMEANQMDLYIQIQGATALWNLGSPHNNLKKEVIQFGGIETISKAMGNFIASAEMQDKGIIALWTLSSSSPSLEPATTSRAIEAIADAIAAHLLSTDICKHGLGALSTLASSKSVVKDIDTVVDLILSCMWAHPNSATIQQGALSALSKISIDDPTNQVLQITPNDLDAVVNSMRTHLLVKDVQENSVVLLRSLAFCPANVTIMGQNPFLVGLMKSTMSRFGGSLRVNVEVLLRLLPSDK